MSLDTVRCTSLLRKRETRNDWFGFEELRNLLHNLTNSFVWKPYKAFAHVCTRRFVIDLCRWDKWRAMNLAGLMGVMATSRRWPRHFQVTDKTLASISLIRHPQVFNGGHFGIYGGPCPYIIVFNTCTVGWPWFYAPTGPKEMTSARPS